MVFNAPQLSVRKYDLDVIEHGYAFGVKKALDLDYEFIRGDEPIEFLGKNTMLIHDTDHHGRGGVILNGRIQEGTRSN